MGRRGRRGAHGVEGGPHSCVEVAPAAGGDVSEILGELGQVSHLGDAEFRPEGLHEARPPRVPVPIERPAPTKTVPDAASTQAPNRLTTSDASIGS